jgi:hypothetical protein
VRFIARPPQSGRVEARFGPTRAGCFWDGAHDGILLREESLRSSKLVRSFDRRARRGGRLRVVVLPNKMMSLEYLQSIYRDKTQSLHVRMRAAAIAIAYESPKLCATAVFPLNETFAALLDRARVRSEKVRVIEARPAEPKAKPTPTVEIKPHLPTIPDKRYRRF